MKANDNSQRYEVEFMARGASVGKLIFSKGQPMQFEGDAEKSAWCFFDALGDEFEARFGPNPIPSRREEYEPGRIKRRESHG